MTIELRKTEVKMDRLVYLGLSVLGISKIATCEYCYDCIKLKCEDNAKLCYRNADSFIVHVRTEDVYGDIAQDVEARFDTSGCDVGRPLPKGKNKKVIGPMKDELGNRIIEYNSKT